MSRSLATLIIAVSIALTAATSAAASASGPLSGKWSGVIADGAHSQRIAIVERSWILGPLFLFNNLHSLHHESPRIPWYHYNRHYRVARDRLIAENGGLVYRSYLEVARRFLFWPHDELRHPTGRVPFLQADHAGKS